MNSSSRLKILFEMEIVAMKYEEIVLATDRIKVTRPVWKRSSAFLPPNFCVISCRYPEKKLSLRLQKPSEGPDDSLSSSTLLSRLS